ncbi:MAG TPA: amino acid adenylation domain-containing protein [Dongiaceae bacterium]|nr:amino acid adenylation domain-containing protein [Dongiaceae bacterium]
MTKAGRPLYAFVDDCAVQWPDMPALRDEQHVYTYGQLSRLSSYFAHRICVTGDVAGKHIGLLYDRSAQSVILLLAIMKAGGIYIPLNRALPEERLVEMMSGAGIALVVAPDEPSIVIDRPIVTLASVDPSHVATQPPLPASTGLAYAIFTSGSTGMPKLALLRHEAVAYVMTALTERYHITRSDRVLQFANLSFDGSISEIFGAFIAGAELIIPGEQTVQSLTRLASYFDSEAVSVAILPPSLLAHLPLSFRYLKTVVVAGEACPSSLARTFTKQVPHFINAYGPTECSICVSTYEVPKDFDGSITPIGDPLPGVNTVILDENGQPVATGVTGELYVGGPSLFDGYYNDSAKTSAALIERGAEGLFYKTGDYVTLEGKILTYVSRSDDYIKLHGLRISPLEIEEAIRHSDDSIRGVAVVVVENGDDSSLVAFYESEHELPVDNILRSIKRRLPAYAVPHKIVHLAHLPLTDNKKINRRALAAWVQTNVEPAPASDSSLRALWQTILQIAIDDMTDFFLAGGDSLKAMRLIAEIDRQYGTSLSLSDLYDHPTFGDFSAHIEAPSPSSSLRSYNPQDLTPYEVMMWSASAHSGNAGTYTLVEVVEPHFDVDPVRLEQALVTLSDNFSAASYRYILGENGLEKRLASGIGFVNHGDLTEVEGDELANSLASTGIDLAADALITVHFALIDASPTVIIHAHHIVLSASILKLFVDELWQRYAGLAVLQKAEEAPREFTEGDLAFWKKAYDSTADYVQLPWSGIRQPKPKNEGATFVTTVDASIDRLALELGITKFVFYRSVFALLLHRLTGQPSFYIGSSVDVRHGDFLGTRPAMLNSLPILSVLKSEQTFMDFALETQHVVRAALSHCYVPLHDIMKLHAFEQDRLVGPFNVLFDYIEKPSSYEVPGLGAIDSKQRFNSTAKHDLTLTVVESSGTELQWEYDTDLLDERTVRQFATIFAHLCHTVLHDLHSPITSLPLLDEGERVAMLSIGRGQARVRSASSFYDRFADMVRQQPDAIAVRHQGRSTSYQDLYYLVEHFSAILVEQELSQDAPVGVFMERSPEMVAIIVALWRLGYAYVPIETTLPSQRIRSIIETTRMSLMMTKVVHRAKLPVDSMRIIDETYQPKILHTPETTVSPDTLAYVIFTSGSTGTPKGVMIEHAGMMNHADGMIEYLALDSASTIAQTASHSFDISVWQLTTMLIAGGTIAIYSKDEQSNLGSFTTRLFEDRVTLLELVPSYINILLEYLEDTHNQQKLKRIDALISTGENISWPIIEGWLRNMPGSRLMNAYGPAEASDDTNLFTFKDLSAMQRRGLPVGTSLANVNAYVLDEALNPQPIGVQGEIYIAGIAVGRGYINDPERTRKSFIDNPHTGERMYKTGDLGYWSSEGQLVYLGRSDFQVKIRGFRIELEEIEAHIIRYPHITSVAVVVVDRNNSKQLHAYVTADIEIDSNVVLSHLRDHLPDYMVPSSIVQLSALPLNNSGKIDRHFLANKERLRFKQVEEIAGPSGEEAVVMAVWREVFGLDYVSVDDDYYALGGDSITSFRVYAKLSAKGYQLTLQDILAFPVLKDFARTITSKSVDVRQIRRIDKVLLVTPIQSRLLAAVSKEAMAQNICLKGHWDRERLNNAIQAVAKKQGVFYLMFDADGQRFGSKPQFKETYAFVDSSVIEDDAFDRLNSELARGALFAYGADGSNTTVKTLYLSANHLVMDVVSWNIFISAMQDAYEVASPVDNEIDYTFGSWAQALQDANDPSSETLDHWRDVLAQTADATRVLKQLFVYDIPERQLFTVDAPLPSIQLTDASVYLAVLRALGQTLNTAQPGVLIETHGRYGEVLGIDLSRTVGWFTHLLPLAGATSRDIESILHADDMTKLAYGLATQRGLLNRELEPLIVVNYLGRSSNMRGYALRHSAHERPISKELLELSIYADGSSVHVELVLYATPKDDELVQKLLTSITQQFSTGEANLEKSRLDAILKRIGANHG